MSAQTRMETALSAIRRHTRTIVMSSMAHLNSEFAKLGGEIRHKFSGDGPLTSAQAKKIHAAVVAGLNHLARAGLTRTNDDTGEVADEVVSELKSAHELAAHDEDVSVTLSHRFDGVSDSTFARIDRGHGRTRALPLLFNQYRDAAIIAIALLLSRAIDREVSEKDVAADVATLLVGGDVQYGKYGITSQQATGLRTFLPASQRIDMSETFNTMRTATAAGMDAGGFVLAAQWTLSPNHTVDDVCDEIALDDVGFGKGIYLVSDWPLAPHPHCACSMGSPIRFKPKDQW